MSGKQHMPFRDLIGSVLDFYRVSGETVAISTVLFLIRRRIYNAGFKIASLFKKSKKSPRKSKNK
jgi:hypothetical protein